MLNTFKTEIDEIAGAGLQFMKVKPEDVDQVTGFVEIGILQDVIKIAAIFIAFGRMFQEFTIDAAKTCLKIEIPYAKKIRNIFKLLSRVGQIDCQLNFDKKSVDEGKSVELKFDRGGEGWRLNELTGKWKYFVNDEFYKLEVAALKVVGQLMEQLVKVRPEFSGAMIAYIDKKKREDAVFAACCSEARFIKDNGYAALSDAQDKELTTVRREYWDDEDELEEQEKFVKNKFRAYFQRLGNKLRLAFETISKFTGVEISRSTMALACLDASLRDNEGKIVTDESLMSTFADNVLGEEFTSLMMSKMKQKGETVIEYAEEKLEVCTYNDGEYAEFALGEAIEMDDDGNIVKHAIPKNACRLDGKYLIVKVTGEDGKESFVARKSIYDALVMPEIDHSVDIVVTTPVKKGKLNIDKLIEASKDNEVSFFQKRDTKQGTIRDAIVCNGVAYERYRRYAYTGDNKRLLNAFYSIGSGVTGKLVEAIPMSYTVKTKNERGYLKEEEYEYAILVLEEVHPTKGFVPIHEVVFDIKQEDGLAEVPAEKVVKTVERFEEDESIDFSVELTDDDF